MRDTLHTSNLETGLLFGAIAVLSRDRDVGRRRELGSTLGAVLHAAACALVVALGCAGAALLTDPIARFASLALAQIAVIAFLAPFWVLPTILLSGSSAAVGIALVNAIGNIGGFVGPTIIGFLKNTTGGDNGALLSLSTMAFAAAIVCVAMRRFVPRER